MKYFFLLMTVVLSLSVAACSKTDTQQEERIKELESQVAQLQSEKAVTEAVTFAETEQESETETESESEGIAELSEIPNVEQLKEAVTEAFSTLDYQDWSFDGYRDYVYDPMSTKICVVIKDNRTKKIFLCPCMQTPAVKDDWHVMWISDEKDEKRYYPCDGGISSMIDLYDIKTDELIKESEMDYEQWSESLDESIDDMEKQIDYEMESIEESLNKKYGLE